MKLLFETCLFLSLLCLTTAAPCSIYVSSKNNPSPVNCDRPESPCPTILDGINVALNQKNCTSASILLEKGRYFGPNNTRLYFTGGDYKQLTSIKFSTFPIDAEFALIDGEKKYSAFEFHNIHTVELTFSYLVFDQTSSTNHGSAIWFDNVTLPITVENCYFLEGRSEGTGGALSINDAVKFTAKNNIFEKNYASNKGGAIFYESLKVTTSGVFQNNSFLGNRGQLKGGAMYLHGNTQVKDSIFQANAAHGSGGQGGAIFMSLGSSSSSSSIQSSTFLQNWADDAGGALYLHSNSTSPSLTLFDLQLRLNNVTKGNGGAIFTENVEGNFSFLHLEDNQAFQDESGKNGNGSGIYITMDTQWRTKHNTRISDSTIQDNTADGAGGGIYCNNAASSWKNVSLNNNKAFLNRQWDDVYCDPFCQSQYCATCACNKTCSECPGESCALTSSHECICYVHPLDKHNCLSDPGEGNRKSLSLGLVFGLVLPLVLIFVVGVFLYRYWVKRRQLYIRIDDDESTTLHPM